MEKDANTEERILKAAEEIFQEKGFEGARMREIADTAKINKGLLHYYFKTKSKLFEMIFSKALSKMILKIEEIMKSEAPFLEKVDLFIDHYLGLLSTHPHLPKFVIGELNRNPDQFVSSILAKNSVKPRLELFYQNALEAMEKNEIKNIDPRQLFINIISLSVFPFIGKPMLQGALELTNEEFKEIMKDRKTLVKSFVKDAIRK